MLTDEEVTAIVKNTKHFSLNTWGHKDEGM